MSDDLIARLKILAGLAQPSVAKDAADALARIAELTARAEKAEAECAALRMLEAGAEDLLQDPVAVHANMLRGVITKPSWNLIRHLYPEAEKAEALLDRAVEAVVEVVSVPKGGFHTLAGDWIVTRETMGKCRATLAAIREAQTIPTAPAKGGEG